MKRLRRKLSYANVISTLCLFLLLGGGAAFAATRLPKNSVGTRQLKNGAVTLGKLSSSTTLALQGAPGATGPGGAVGSVGPRGPQGDKGEKGERGEEGEAGELGEEGGIGLTGPRGEKGDEGEQGVSGLSGLHEVVATQIIPKESSAVARAHCPSQENATGGGSFVEGDGTRLAWSSPEPEEGVSGERPTGWAVEYLTGAEPVVVYVYALCTLR
ncbi:MAG TPA: hypothetical protein VHZ54_12630 [Solirubrobacterales bacterium]|jgi:hypothetical protein|nr:hypothetical protein [Solirubrobacterales bacterium]